MVYGVTCGVPGSHGNTHPHPQTRNITTSMEHRSGIRKDREKAEYKMWNIICNVDNIIRVNNMTTINYHKH